MATNQDNILKQLLDKMQKLEENINSQLQVLDHENKNRAKEIENLAKNFKTVILTDDTSITSRRTGVDTGDEGEDEMETTRTRQPTTLAAERITATDQLMKATEAIRMIETLRGRDDVGVEDFIKSVRFARNNCSEKNLLLRLILIEKITENAKRSIRYTTINTFEELYETLRRNVSIPNTVSSCRNKLQQLKQGATETIQSYNLRFRQQLNELIYAVQNKHTRPISREIAIEEEENEAVRTYILNLRRDIGILVIPSKPKTLIDAQIMAAEMELWVHEANRTGERKPAMTRSMPPKLAAPMPRQQSLSPTPLNERPPIRCTKCNRIGHTSDKCYARNFPFAQQGKLPPRVNQTQEEKNEEEISPGSIVLPQDDCSPYYMPEDQEITEDFSSTLDPESIY